MAAAESALAAGCRVISFSVPGIPVAKGRPRLSVRFGHAHAYTPAKTRQAENLFAARAMAYAPETPIAGPISMTLRLIFPFPASMPKKRKIDGMPHVTKPDADNACKMILDSLQGAFFLDDKQIYALTVTKEYGPVPQTCVVINESPFN